MSALLLDTHIWLWYAEGDSRQLRPSGVRRIDDARQRDGLAMSAISVWEIGVHSARGRIQLSAPLRDWVERATAAPGLRILPIDASVARALLKRLGLSYDHVLGVRYTVNVFIATTIVWFTLKSVSDSNPIWAIASMVAASDPVPEEARRLFRSRLVNVLVGCVVGRRATALVGSDRERACACW